MQRQQDTMCRQIELPGHILDFLKTSNGFRRQYREYTYSVTELARCKRNTFFKKSRLPQEEMLSDNISDLWSSVRGNLLHEMASAYSWNELEASLDVPLEDGRKFMVCGRLDMYDHKTKTIIDLKTVNDVKKLSMDGQLPMHDHVLQVQAYYTIFSKIIPVENLNLVYADMNDLIAFEVPIKDVSGWMVRRIAEIQNHIESGNVPEGEVSSKCRFCRYQTACMKRGGGIKEKPLSAPKDTRRFSN